MGMGSGPARIQHPDWGILGQNIDKHVDYGQLEMLGGPSARSDIDWGILADPGAAISPAAPSNAPVIPAGQGGRHQEEDEEDMEFTVFDGFQDNKPVRITEGNKAGAGRDSG